MSAVKQIGKWLKRLFILACMLALCFSAVIYLARNELMGVGQSLTIGLMIIFAIIIVHRQSMISREFRNMKSQSAALIQYKDDMKRHLEALTLRVDALGDPSNGLSQGAAGADDAISPLFQADHSEAIAILNSRINSMQDSAASSEDRIRPDFTRLITMRRKTRTSPLRRRLKSAVARRKSFSTRKALKRFDLLMRHILLLGRSSIIHPA